MRVIATSRLDASLATISSSQSQIDRAPTRPPPHRENFRSSEMLGASTPFLLLVTLAFVAAVAVAQRSDPNAEECAFSNLFNHLQTIEDVCCTDAAMCADGPPAAGDQCSKDCAEIFEPFCKFATRLAL